ncbi:hypothetical protein BDN67DRAFT_576743 [Paxillus ammoniavirescens]|nr:hypothetical protein BDN67DRAFT_576743 [Paxillus ammoniavirescens]
MPPGPAFGWLCVAHSVVDIAIRAAQIRSVQAVPKPVAYKLSATRTGNDASEEMTQLHNVESSTWSSPEPHPVLHGSAETGTLVKPLCLEVPACQEKVESSGVLKTEGYVDISGTQCDTPQPARIQPATMYHAEDVYKTTQTQDNVAPHIEVSICA